MDQGETNEENASHRFSSMPRTLALYELWVKSGIEASPELHLSQQCLHKILSCKEIGIVYTKTYFQGRPFDFKNDISNFDSASLSYRQHDFILERLIEADVEGYPFLEIASIPLEIVSMVKPDSAIFSTVTSIAEIGFFALIAGSLESMHEELSEWFERWLIDYILFEEAGDGKCLDGFGSKDYVSQLLNLSNGSTALCHTAFGFISENTSNRILKNAAQRLLVGLKLDRAELIELVEAANSLFKELDGHVEANHGKPVETLKARPRNKPGRKANPRKTKEFSVSNFLNSQATKLREGKEARDWSMEWEVSDLRAAMSEAGEESIRDLSKALKRLEEKAKPGNEFDGILSHVKKGKNNKYAWISGLSISAPRKN